MFLVDYRKTSNKRPRRLSKIQRIFLQNGKYPRLLAIEI